MQSEWRVQIEETGGLEQSQDVYGCKEATDVHEPAH